MAEEWYKTGEGEAEQAPEPVKPVEDGLPEPEETRPAFLLIAFKALTLALLGVPATLCLVAVGYATLGKAVPWWYSLLVFGLPLAWLRKGRDWIGRDFVPGLFVLSFVIGMTLVAPFFTGRRHSPQGVTTGCKSNLKNIGTACEMYSTDNEGRYPRSLAQLTPNYLKILPTCYAAGKENYSASYVAASTPDLYTVFCSGHFHAGAGVAPNYPQYTAQDGLVLGPK